MHLRATKDMQIRISHMNLSLTGTYVRPHRQAAHMLTSLCVRINEHATLPILFVYTQTHNKRIYIHTLTGISTYIYICVYGPPNALFVKQPLSRRLNMQTCLRQ